MSLRERLIARIAEEGPMPVADYMEACLHDPQHGYYASRPRLGAEGDFITAPHVSQMFGELIGAWAAACWQRLGRPERVTLAELGPGDGTMLGDVLRAARTQPAFSAAARIVLVERSRPLRAAQSAALAGRPAQWVESIEDLPDDLPMVLLANEFLDCLAVGQQVRRGARWVNRAVGVDEAGALAFRPDHGEVRESSPALAQTGRRLGALLARAGGFGLFIDYGRDAAGPGDTLQAVRGHAKESPLANPGEADLTAHVDFPAFLEAARSGGAEIGFLTTQAAFLRRLGVEARAAALTRAHPDRAGLIGRQLRRLIGEDQMGALFKAACVHAPGLSAP